jgi:hypothetical protein
MVLEIPPASEGRRATGQVRVPDVVTRGNYDLVGRDRVYGPTVCARKLSCCQASRWR